MRGHVLYLLGLPLFTSPALADHDPTHEPLSLNNPAYSDPAGQWTTIEDADLEDAGPVISEGSVVKNDQLYRVRRAGSTCRDEIVQADTEDFADLRIERELASPDRPYLIYAVDRREGGCSLMLMKDAFKATRPLPLPMDGHARIIPAETGQD